MSDNTIYFGTKDFMTFVPCPLVDMTRGLNGWSNEGTFIGGGGYSTRSRAGHRVYNMAWGKKHYEDIYKIHAFANGDFGDGLIYFIDPFAVNTNLMPQAWASPWMACDNNGPNLAGRGQANPSRITTPSNTYEYPLYTAQYTLGGSETPLDVWIPLPPGYTLHVGAHGSATGSAAVTVTPDSSSTVNLTMLGANTATRTNYTLSGDTGATVSIGGTGTLDLTSVVAFILKTGFPATTGSWRPGEGHSGCVFTEPPSDTAYSAVFDLRATTATLKEVGSWPDP